MALEDEMRNEISKLEKETAILDDEIQKLYTKIANLINIRKKKEYELKALRGNFGIYSNITERDVQTSLSRMLKEMI
jgi:predicted  nucleic acid-binding Zn-ribbon protein